MKVDKQLIREQLLEIIKDLSGDKYLTVSNVTSLDIYRDLLASSILLVSLFIEIERTFRIELPETCMSVDNYHNFEQICDMINDIYEINY